MTFPGNAGQSTVPSLQRLFSTFPAGLPGLALLLLRVSVAAAAFQNSCGYDSHRSPWVLFGMALLALALCTGFLTPIVALLAVGAQLMKISGVFHSGAPCVVTILVTLALAMLGPGAYSIDARRFGRRILVLPPRDSPGPPGP